MPTYASSDLVKFGLLAEATEGIFNTTAAFEQQLTSGITPEFSQSFIDDPTISGEGEPADKRTNLRGFNLTTPYPMRYNDLRLPVSAALRDSFPSEVTVVGSSNIDVLTAGTHLDTTTGPQLRAPTGTFDTLINYDGVTASTNPNGGAEALLAILSGSATSDNNGKRRIKAVHDDSTNAFIDFYPGYDDGAAGLYGAPLGGTTSESITIKVGAAVRNRLTGGSSYSALWNFADMATNAGWQSAFGLVANDLGVSFSGKDAVQVEIPWVGYGSNELVSADPTAQGFTSANINFEPLISASDDLETFAIVTDSNVIVLSSYNLTDFNYSLAGGVAAIDNVSGISEITGIRRGSHNPTGSIGWYLADDPRSQELTALGSKANNEKAGIDAIWTDGDGNTVALGLLHNEFAPTGPSPGAGGNTVTGTLEFSGHRRTNKSRSFVWQEFSA